MRKLVMSTTELEAPGGYVVCEGCKGHFQITLYAAWYGRLAPVCLHCVKMWLEDEDA